jgi:hypothetical protein
MHRSSADDCAIGTIDKICLGDRDGGVPFVLMGVTDDGFVDSAVSGIIFTLEGSCASDGNNEG